jgi:serine protease Do
MLAVAVVAGLTGAAVAVTALALTGSLSPRVVQKEPVVSSAQLAAVTTLPAPPTVRALARKAAVTVAEVHVAVGALEKIGSAVVLQADGVLLTSEALVRDVGAAKVLLADGRQLKATVVGRDPEAGLAVLRVPADDLTAAAQAATLPKPGDQAITVAGRSSAGTEPWVSLGVVSSTDRSVPITDGQLWGLIETDSPVPQNADGGALLDPDGNVSGISLHLASDGGLGYAVPIEVASMIGLDLLEHGRVRAAWLGVMSANLGEPEAEELGVDGGARLTSVAPDGPAARAGLRPDDVIIRVGTNAIRARADLTGSMHTHRPGEVVSLLVLRDGKEISVDAKLRERSG